VLIINSCTIVTNNLSRLPCESKIAIFESYPISFSRTPD
jgi:hypothetical protein